MPDGKTVADMKWKKSALDIFRTGWQ